MDGTSDPWASASQKLSQFARTDTSVAKRLNRLGETQAHQTKLAFAIEEGRIYGLRQEKLNNILRRQLEKAMRRPPVQNPW